MAANKEAAPGANRSGFDNNFTHEHSNPRDHARDLRRDPRVDLHRARQTHRDAVEALPVPDRMKVPLIAAAEVLARARAVVAIAEFIDARKLAAREPAS